jgi:hypothetical protein
MTWRINDKPTNPGDPESRMRRSTAEGGRGQAQMLSQSSRNRLAASQLATAITPAVARHSGNPPT